MFKTFFLVKNAKDKYVGLFIPAKAFQPSLMFANTARANSYRNQVFLVTVD